MPLSVNAGFDEFLRRLTPLESQRTASKAHRLSVEKSLKAGMTVNAIRETGSFHHGTGVRNHCDVDVLVSIGDDRPGSSVTALGWVRDALKASFPYTTVRVSRPAVVVEFNGGAETWEVIPGFLTGRGGAARVYDIPGAATGWMDSAPSEHLQYVNDCNNAASTKGGAKKLARLAKAWKYYRNVPISSFYLEMRAAQHVATQATFIPVWDICQLLEKLDSHSLAGMNDPRKASGQFAACSSEANREAALSKLTTAAGRARRALDAYNEDPTDAQTAFFYLDLLFGGRFPSRL
jgi:hypothetical protein